MKIKNGRLTDYNYWEIKEIVRSAVWRYTRERLYILIKGLKEEIDNTVKEAESMPKSRR